MPIEPILEINYAAFIDSQWHKTVLWTCEMIGQYSMTELWSMDIVRFTKLTFEARSIQNEKRKQAMRERS
jgi:hypothetical protein